MSGLMRHRPSPSMAVALVALVIAMGGTSYAAFKLPGNSVGSAQIRPKAVKGSDLGGNAVSSSKVLNGSLLRADFKASELPAGPKGDAGAKGDPGPKGDTGAPGTNGTNGTTGAPGPFPDPLSPGKTVRGRYFFVDQSAAAGELQATGVSFVFSLPAIPVAHFIPAAARLPRNAPARRPLPPPAPGTSACFRRTT